MCSKGEDSIVLNTYSAVPPAASAEGLENTAPGRWVLAPKDSLGQTAASKRRKRHSSGQGRAGQGRAGGRIGRARQRGGVQDNLQGQGLLADAIMTAFTSSPSKTKHVKQGLLHLLS
jgi:hypothetical protein